MHFRRLGRTNLQVSALGLGGGGQSRLGRVGDAPPEQIRRLIARAIELGINLFDTAADYGTEDILGQLLAEYPRDSILISTKFNPTTRQWAIKDPAELRLSLDRSLSRLQTDYVDVLFLHGVRARQYAEITERFLEPLREVQRAGLARFIGVTESWGTDHTHDMLREAIPSGAWDVVMPGYNLMSPGAGVHVLPLAEHHDVGTLIMCAVRSVMSQPDLVTRQIATWKDEGRLAADAPASLDWVFNDSVESLTAAAYRFAAQAPGVSSVLCGTGSIQHLEDNVRAILGPPLAAEVSQHVTDLFVPVGRNVGHGARA
jgi:aryl-alcohol dehydrogenase-like predicted oxidoreductase